MKESGGAPDAVEWRWEEVPSFVDDCDEHPEGDELCGEYINGSEEADELLDADGSGRDEKELIEPSGTGSSSSST